MPFYRFFNDRLKVLRVIKSETVRTHLEAYYFFFCQVMKKLVAQRDSELKDSTSICILMLNSRCVTPAGVIVKKLFMILQMTIFLFFFFFLLYQEGKIGNRLNLQKIKFTFPLTFVLIAELPRAKRASSGAPWVRKFGKLSIREHLVMTQRTPAHPYTHFM